MNISENTRINDFLRNTKIRFLGTGGIFDYQLGNSSAIVRLSQGTVLIDCGYTTFTDLSQKKMLDSIDYLLLTHLHGDHTGGLHPAILYWANKRKVKIKIIYPTEDFKTELEGYLKVFLLDVGNYVDFIPISSFNEIGYLDTNNYHVNGLQSFAYYFNLRDQFIYFSGDLGDVNVSANFLKEISHKNVYVFHEVFFVPSDVHVYYKELEDLAKNFVVFAYHCNAINAPFDCKLNFVAMFSELVY